MILTRGGYELEPGTPLFKFTVPSIVSMWIFSLYSLVDGMFVAWGVGEHALTAVNLSLPFVSLVFTLGILLATGTSTVLSIALGQKDVERARNYFNQNLFVVIAATLLLAVLVLFNLDWVADFLGATGENHHLVKEYVGVIACFSVFFTVSYNLEVQVKADGAPHVSIIGVISCGLMNVVLDYIFVMHLHWGVWGAALATVLAQGCSALWVLKFLTGRRALLRLRWNTLRLQAARVRRILALGTSGFVMSMTNSLVQVLCNASLQHYGGDLYVGVMTVINSIREVVSMPVQGITNGCQPVLGYNYGAGEYERVRRGIRFTTVLTVGYSVAAWALVMAVPELLIRIFNDEPELIAAGIPAFRLYFAAFFCMSFQFIGQSVFVGLGRSRSAVFFSLLRKAFIVAPLTLLLPGLGMGVDGVFAAEPVSNVLGGLACLLTMYITVYRRLGR